VCVNTAYFIRSGLIIKIKVGLLLLKVFPADERHVYLYVWTMKILKQ